MGHSNGGREEQCLRRNQVAVTCFNLAKGCAPFNRKWTNRCTHKRLHHGSCAECQRKIAANRSHKCARRADNFHAQLWPAITGDSQSLDMHWLGIHGNRPSSTCQPIGSPTIDVNGGVVTRPLKNLAAKAIGCRFDRRVSGLNRTLFLLNLRFQIIGRAGPSQEKRGAVVLGEFVHVIDKLCCMADADDHNAGGQRIERACMADSAHAHRSGHCIDDAP